MVSLESLCNTYTLIFIGVCLWLWHRSTSTFNHWKKQKVPFKKPVPVFGNITRYALLLECFHEFLDEMYYYFEDAPLFGIFQMLEPVMILKDPEVVHTIMIKDFNNFYDRGLDVIFPHKKLNPLSYHLLAASGNRWRELRKKLTPVFTSKKLRLMQDHMTAGIGNLEKFLDERMVNESTDQDLKNVYERLTLDVIGSCAFGIDCNSLKENEDFRTHANLAFKTTIRRIVTNLLDKKYRLRLKLTDHPKKVVDFFMGVVLNTMQHRRESGMTRNDLLQQLMEVQNCCIDSKYAVPESTVADSGKFLKIGYFSNYISLE